VFYYRWGKKQKSFTIGEATNDPAGWTLAKARTEALELRLKVGKNINPADEKKSEKIAQAKTGNVFSGVAHDYLEAKTSELKPRSLAECKRHLDRHWKTLNDLPLAAIDRFTVASHLRKIAKDSGAVAANRCRSTLSAMFAWAIGEGLCDENPVVGTNKNEEKDRERILTDGEIVAIWGATKANDYGRIVRLLMLTAQRRQEIGGLRWSEIDGLEDRAKALITFSGGRTKNGCRHEVPLCEDALDILGDCPRRDGRDPVFGEGDGGYSGWSRSKRDLDTACGVGNWTLHDLRRTAATRMADLGVLPHVVEAILNHVSGHKGGVAGIYNRSTYASEKRAALILWTVHVKTIVAQAQGANVARLKWA
jgi:integrase